MLPRDRAESISGTHRCQVPGFPQAPLPGCLTWLQVSELGQRAHLQVLNVKGFGLSPRQVPDKLSADHAHAAQVDQGTEKQRHL